MLRCHWGPQCEAFFSRKGAKAQRKTQNEEQAVFASSFAPLRLCGKRFFCFCRSDYLLRICSFLVGSSSSSSPNGRSKSGGRSTWIVVSPSGAINNDATTDPANTSATKTSDNLIGMLIPIATSSILTPMKVRTIARPVRRKRNFSTTPASRKYIDRKPRIAKTFEV